MSSLPAELIILLILVLINGAFSMAEIALVSSRKAKLRVEAENGDAGAEKALNLAEEPGVFSPPFRSASPSSASSPGPTAAQPWRNP